jgi:hypothetical protein
MPAVLQVVLFFQQAQTVRNLLAPPRHFPENVLATDGIRRTSRLLAVNPEASKPP